MRTNVGGRVAEDEGRNDDEKRTHFDDVEQDAEWRIGARTEQRGEKAHKQACAGDATTERRLCRVDVENLRHRRHEIVCHLKKQEHKEEQKG